MNREQRVEAWEDRLADRFGLDVRRHVIACGAPGATVRLLDVGAGPAIVFLHPAGFFGACWLPVAARLRGHRCVLVDQPGHGLSAEANYRQVDPRVHNTEALVAVLDALGLDRALFVGNSLGGQCSLWLAMDRPERVERLVIVGVPAVAFPGCHPDLGLALVSVPIVNRVFLGWPHPRFIHRCILANALGQRAMRAIEPEILEIHFLASRGRAWRNTMCSLMERLLRWRSPRPDMELSDDELATVGQPTLIIWGDHDIYGGEAMARRAAAIMKNASIEVMRAGHAPYLDDADRFADGIRRFVNGRAQRSNQAGHQGTAPRECDG